MTYDVIRWTHGRIKRRYMTILCRHGNCLNSEIGELFVKTDSDQWKNGKKSLISNTGHS